MILSSNESCTISAREIHYTIIRHKNNLLKHDHYIPNLDKHSDTALVLGNSEKTTILEEELILKNLNIPFALIFSNFIFKAHLSFAYSKIKAIHLIDCNAQSVDAIGLSVDDDFGFFASTTGENESVCNGTLRLTNAVIGKRLVLNGTSFHEGHKDQLEKFLNYNEVPPRGAIDAGKITVGSSVWMTHVDRNRDKDYEDENKVKKFTSRGQVFFCFASIGGRFVCHGATFEAGRHSSFLLEKEKKNLDGFFENNDENDEAFNPPYTLFLSLPGFMEVLNKRLKTSLGVYKRYLLEWIENRIGEKSGHYERQYLRAFISLDTYGFKISGSVSFEDCTFIGTVRMGSSEVGGKLEFTACKFFELPKNSLPRLSSKCKRDPHEIYSDILESVHYFASSLYLARGALDAYRITVKGSVYISDSLRDFGRRSKEFNSLFYGRISFVGATVDGRFNIHSSLVQKSCEFLGNRFKPMAAIELTNAKIGQHLYLGDGLCVIGSVLLYGLETNGRIYIRYCNFQGTMNDTYCLKAKGLRINQDIEIFSSCFFGLVSFSGSVFSKSVNISYCLFLPIGSNSSQRIGLIGNPVTDMNTSDLFSVSKIHLTNDSYHDTIVRNILDFSSCRIGEKFIMSTMKDDEHPLSADDIEHFHNLGIKKCGIVLGRLTLKNSVIDKELDLSNASLGNFVSKIIFQGSSKNTHPLSKTNELKPSISFLDLRHLNVSNFRINEYIPSPGYVLANGFSFKSLAGDIFKLDSVGIKFLINTSVIEIPIPKNQKNADNENEIESGYYLHEIERIDDKKKSDFNSSRIRILENIYSLFKNNGKNCLNKKYYESICYLHNSVKNTKITTSFFPRLIPTTFLSFTSTYLAIFLLIILSLSLCFDQESGFKINHGWLNLINSSTLIWLYVIALKYIHKKSSLRKSFRNQFCYPKITKFLSGLGWERVFNMGTMFGYKPFRVFYLAIIITLSSSLSFHVLAYSGYFVSNEGFVYRPELAKLVNENRISVYGKSLLISISTLIPLLSHSDLPVEELYFDIEKVGKEQKEGETSTNKEVKNALANPHSVPLGVILYGMLTRRPMLFLSKCEEKFDLKEIFSDTLVDDSYVFIEPLTVILYLLKALGWIGLTLSLTGLRYLFKE